MNLGVLRILLSPGRAESPMERLAQGKRSGTLGWVVVSKTIYALKGQKRGYCAFVSHTKCYVLSVRRFSNFFQSAMFLRFCPFRAWIFYFCLTYPGCRFACPARRSIGLSARLGRCFACPGVAKERILRKTANGRVYYYEDSMSICIFLSKSANI